MNIANSSLETHSIFDFCNQFSQLPERFYSRHPPISVSQPKLVALNESLANELGIDVKCLDQQEFTNIFSGNRVAASSKPLSMVYSGHQFGNWVPRLGDGRAHLLGEIKDQSGQLLDVQLKGSGPTLFSRGADGRAGIGPVLREFLVSEGMYALGIPTTRALSAILTGDTIYRESALPGAVLTRIARSHIRVGTFQYFFSRQDIEGLEILLNFTINRLYPSQFDGPSPALDLLDATVEGQAELIAKWMGVGFIHGVMNTDNMSLACETIDFGPCAFMDEFHSNKVFSSIDWAGRYAYNRQPSIARWNLAQLANALLPLIDVNQEKAIKTATKVINSFDERFQYHWHQVLLRKFGFFVRHEGDSELFEQFFRIMESAETDFTVVFRLLVDCINGDHHAINNFFSQFGNNNEIKSWLPLWQARLDKESRDLSECAALMRATNPVVIPRNHQIEKVVQLALNEDYDYFFRMLSAIQHPFEDTHSEFQVPPLPDERVKQTFCGT